ncbi:MAG: ABC transporter substrate-binding protein [Planctomycetota bacterium]
MTNRFGFKDFVQIVLLGAVLVLGFLQMLSADRHWNLQRDILEKLGAIEKRMAQQSAAQPAASQVSASQASSPHVGAGSDEKVLAALKAIEERLASGVVAVSASGGGSGAGSGAGSGGSSEAAAGASSCGRDESWAVPGVAVEWQDRWDYSTDPKSQPGFQEGGEFTEIFEGQPAKVTPYLSSDVYGRRVIDRVCDSLGAYDPKTLRFRGVLASAWQQDPKGMWIRVRIRDDARFSDGEPVTAEDVRWTFKDFIFNPSIEAERTRSTLDQIVDVKVIDAKTAEIVFSRALSFNLEYSLGIYVLPKHFYSKFEPAQVNGSTGLLMGSGPYKLERLDPSEQWAPGKDLVLARNENYWGPRSPLDRLRFKVVQDDLARLVAYRNGEGDMIIPTSPQFVKTTKEAGWDDANQSLRWINMRSGYSFIAWNGGKRNGRDTPFADKRVRQAMTLCLDRERFIKDIFEGIGVVAKGSVNPESPASDPSLKPWPFDPAKGKALLAEAGWVDRNGDGILENEKGDPFRFEFTRSGGGEIAERVSNFVKDSYAKVGILVTVRVVDWSIMQEISKSRDFDALTMAWSSSAPESDPRQIFHSESIKEGGDNFAQWSSPRADQLIDAIRSELDVTKRMELWHDFEALLHEDQPYTFIRVSPWLRFVKKSVGNVNTYKTGLEPWEFFRAGSVASPGE